MAGESLPTVDVDERRDAVFAFSARVVDNHVEVSGPPGTWRVGDVASEQVLSQHMGADVRVLAEARIPHQDAGQVSLVGTASLEWCRARLGVDGDARRLRPNLVVCTTEPSVEEEWVGHRLRIGDAELAAVERIERCRMVDIAQEGLDEQPGWLRGLGRERGLCLGIYAEVTHPGLISVHDTVHVLT